MRRWTITRLAFELKLEDLWIGVFWRHGYAKFDYENRPMWTDVWICLLPCCPLHVTIFYFPDGLFREGEQ